MVQTMREKHVPVLGIGNVLWADEGFGARCVESLQREWTYADLPAHWRRPQCDGIRDQFMVVT